VHDVTCAIPTRDDDPAILERVLDAAAPQLERPLIVVDMSTGSGVRDVAERHDGVEYVPYPESTGVSASRNECLRRARTRHVILLDADAVPEPGWARALSAALELDRVAIAGARVVADWEGRPPALFDTVTAGDWLSLFDFGDESREVPRVMGTSYALDLDRLGDIRFDESVGRRPGVSVAGEEVVLALAAARAGWRCWYAADAVVRHQIPRSRASWPWMLRRAFDAGRESRRPSGDGLEPLPRRLGARDRLFRALVAPAFLAGRVRGV
jgi:GT2 family glycosyltransferase